MDENKSLTPQEKRKQYEREWHQKNKVRRAEQAKQRRVNRSQEQILEDRKKALEYKYKNIDKWRDYGKIAARKYRADDPEKFRIRDIKRKYKVTLDEAQDLHAKRIDPNRVCDSCGEKKFFEDGTQKQLNIDHCHVTMKIRGFLCKECNTGYGQYRENADLISKGIEWLKKHSE